MNQSDATKLKAFIDTLADPAPMPSRPKLYFSYFGDAAGNAAAFGDHCNMVFVPEWGEDDTDYQIVMDRNISFMKEAAAAGIQNVVYDVGFQLWGPDTRSPLKPTALAELTKVFGDLHTAGVLHMVRALYPIDEPDLAGKSDSDMFNAVGVVRAAAKQFVDLADVQVWCIYGQNGTPGVDAFDAVGWDNYQSGAGALGWYAQLPAGKGKILVPGGAEPWKNDPGPFVQRALSDPTVVAVIAFLWVDYAGGKGINDNGMLAAYRAAGKQIIAQT